MTKLLAIFTMFFMVQVGASNREITYTTKDPKGKDPLPEKASLLINETKPIRANKQKFDLGVVRTNLKLNDILQLDEYSIIKMLALQKTLREGQKCCCGYLASPPFCKSDHEPHYEIVLGSDYQNLLVIANKQEWVVNELGWDVNEEGIIVRHKGDISNNHNHDYNENGDGEKCLIYSSGIPTAGSLWFLIQWGCCPKALGCTISKCTAFTIMGSLLGVGGACLACGGICHECNTRGKDYQRLQKLYAIMKPTK